MSFLQRLKRAGKKSNKDYTDFIRTYKKDDNTIHLFYEGYEDPSFYGSAIREVLNEERKVYFHRASNKKEVYKHYDLIDWRRYDRNRVLFVVDKDYSDLLGEKYKVAKNIYVTDAYSIENYIVNAVTLERVLIEHCRGNNSDLLLDAVELFESSYLSFTMAIKPLTSYILYHKRNGKATQLNNINLNQLLRVDEDSLEIKTNTRPNNQKRIQYLDNRMQVATPSNTWRAMIGESRVLELHNRKAWIRGKFDIWFFVKFLDGLINSLSRNIGVNLRNPNLSTSNALIILSPISDKPPKLIQFFNERLN